MRTTASGLLMGLTLIGLAFLSVSCTTDITDTISSTIPGIWWGENGTIKEEYKAVAFATLNFENVKRDLARGEGEYLASLGSLLGVRTSEQQQFFSFAQHRAAVLVGTKSTTPEEMVTALRDWPSAARAY
jgi:hypothetical protein